LGSSEASEGDQADSPTGRAPARRADYNTTHWCPLHTPGSHNARVPLPVRSSPQRLLLLSDDVSVSDTCARALHLDGYDVRVALSPGEGLALAERYRPHAVVIDLRMPAPNALDLIERLRRLPGLTHAPVALVTGDLFLSPSEVDRIHALGVTERFRPIWLSELVAVAKQLAQAAVPA
jgi:CheY-like chemotaxis protein